jgi:hypothetical protein
MLLGTTNGAAGAYITVAGYPGEAVTIRPTDPNVHTIASTSGSAGVCGRGYYRFENLIFDGINGNNDRGVILMSGPSSCTSTGSPHHFTFYNNEMKNYERHAILFNGNGHRLQYNKIHDLRSDCVPGNRHYGFYLATGDDVLVEHNEIYNTPGGYMQVYPGNPVPLTNIVIRYNYFHDNGFCSTATFGGIIAGNNQGTQFYNNVSVNNGSADGSGHGTGLTVEGTTGTPTDVIVRNNVFYGNQYEGLVVQAATYVPLRTIVENNLSVGNGSTNIRVTSSPTTVQNTNKTTGAITDYVVSTNDFSLKSGSPCINFGTARSGFLYSGSSPDCGAFESFTPVSATINGHSLDVTFDAVNTPLSAVLGPTGWSVSCASACGGSPAVATVQLLSGSVNVLRADISGISGTDCVAGKTWTVSFDATTGWIQDSTLMGHKDSGIFRNQRGPSFTSFSVTNNCSGAPTGYPGTPYIYYNMNDGNGVTLTNSGSGGPGLNGSLNGGSWGTGHTGSGVVTTAGATQYIGIPYGNGVNPTTQNFTIAFAVKVPVGTESTSRGEAGVSVGSSQRWHVQGVSGTWRLGLQGSSANSAASNHAVQTGWNHICVTNNAATDTATIYLNGVAGTGGAQKTASSSYLLTSNLTLGLYDINTAPGGTYDEFLLYQSVEDCAAIYAAFQPSSSTTGTFAQAATRFQGVHLNTSLAPFDFGSAINQSQEVVPNGAAAVVIQIHCQAGTNCDPSAFPLQYALNGSSSWANVPDMETSEGIWMWGTAQARLNNGTTTSPRLTGSCTVTDGVTVLSTTQSPTVDLPADGCVMLRYIVRVGSTVGNYYDLRVINSNGLAFTGGYQLARIIIVNPRTSGIGF